ncbi:MAG: response regulator transcription factor [Propionibacterium sp.]|nr:response regulator transcription factor [Propionibacterium sp.]
MAVVIEDDEDIRGLLVTLLTQSGFTVHEASVGADGVRAVHDHDPVLVTVDLGLPDIDGYEVTRRIRQFSDAYVLMLTARSEEIDALMGLDVGADDYVVKPFRPRELRARVEAMMRRPRTIGASPSSPSAPSAPTSPAAAPAAPVMPADATGGVDGGGGPGFELDGLRVSPSLFQVVVEGAEVQLTPTEFILLKTLLASKRVVRTKVELSRILRDEDPDSDTFVSAADERSVEVHIGNLRRKLGDDPARPRWVETVRGVGYRAAGDAQRI